jgi:hypothetical protein
MVGMRGRKEVVGPQVESDLWLSSLLFRRDLVHYFG